MQFESHFSISTLLYLNKKQCGVIMGGLVDVEAPHVHADGDDGGALLGLAHHLLSARLSAASPAAH